MVASLSPFRAGGVSAAPAADGNALAASLAVPGKYLLADISEFQPNVADAAYLAWSKAIVIRAAYGDAHDDRAWYGGARRADLHKGGAQFLGIYQFLVAGQDGTAQANALHDLVGPLQKGEVLIADFEQGQHPMLSAWYNRMLALGYPDKYLWTYTGLDFGQANGALPVQWLAAYESSEPSSPHTLWQFTDSYQVPGVGKADCSVFHGTVEQLAALAYGGTVTPPPVPADPPTPAPAGLKQSLRATAYAVSCVWQPVKGVASYHFQFQYYKNGFGWVMTEDAHVPGDQVVAAAPGTRYRWRVAAGLANYVWSDWMELTTP